MCRVTLRLLADTSSNLQTVYYQASTVETILFGMAFTPTRTLYLIPQVKP